MKNHALARWEGEAVAEDALAEAIRTTAMMMMIQIAQEADHAGAKLNTLTETLL